MPQPVQAGPFPPITALRCRGEYLQDSMGGRLGPCDHVARGSNTDEAEEALYKHVRRVHRYPREDAGIRAGRLREAAEHRLLIRAQVVAALAGVGIELSDEQAKAVVKSLGRSGVEMRVDRAAVYRGTGI